MNIDYKSQRAPPPYGNECPVWDIGKMHGHGSAKAEIVRYDVFWCKAESGCSDMNGFGPQNWDDVQGADRAEPLSGRIVADRGDSWAPMFSHAQEDVDPAQTGQAADESDQKCETDSPWIALFWLSRVRTV